MFIPGDCGGLVATVSHTAGRETQRQYQMTFFPPQKLMLQMWQTGLELWAHHKPVS